MGGLLLCVAIVFYYFSYHFTGYEFETVPHDMGPKFMPRLMLGALAIEAIFLIILSINKKKTSPDNEAALKPIFQKRPFIMLGTFLLYIYLTTLLGYIISTIVFLIVAFLLLGVRNKWSLILTPPLFTMGTYYLFGTLLNIYLPSGSLF